MIAIRGLHVFRDRHSLLLPTACCNTRVLPDPRDPTVTPRLPACLQFYGACLAPPHPMLVLEFMEGGDLRKALTKDRSRTLSWYG